MKWCKLIGVPKYISKSDKVLSISNIKYWKVELKINWMHFEQRHFTLSLFLPYHFKEIKETESRVTECVCLGGNGNKDQGPQYILATSSTYCKNFPLIVFSVFQICVFSGGGRESLSGEWLSLRRPVCDLTGARLSRMALNTATTQTQTQLYNYVEKYGNKDLSIRSTGFAALGRALPKQTCAYSQKV